MTARSQNFSTFVGDAAVPTFTVQDQNGIAIDISTVGEIRWSAARTASAAPVLVKTMTGGQISFVTNGTDGMFQVTLAGTDTAALSGLYLHSALLIDQAGNQSTVALGQMTVGIPPVWTYDPTQITTSSLMQVRRLIGDVLVSDQQLYDDEIVFIIGQYSSIYTAAAECCRDIAAQYARKVDTVQGEIRTLYSAQTKRYMVMAADLEMRGIGRGATPYAGGISNADKTNVAQNPDRVPPDFQRGQFDDILLGTVGEQMPVPGLPEVLP